MFKSLMQSLTSMFAPSPVKRLRPRVDRSAQFESLGTGQSFHFKGDEYDAVASAARYHGLRLGRRFSVRQTADGYDCRCIN
jgi:hypothetical protein